MTSKKEQFYIQRIAELEKQVAELTATVAKLLKVNAELTDKIAQLSKNSSNSSKPPSSDIVKPPRESKHNTQGKIGGQPGHPKHERPPFTTDQIDHRQPYPLDACPDCGGVLKFIPDAGRVVQQVEMAKKPVIITEHTGLCYWCEHCRQFHYAPLPPDVEKGQLIGPQLTSVVAYMKSVCHCSYSTIRKYLRDIVGISISRGQLSKLVQKASAALEQAYNELLEHLPKQARLNVDETGHKENKKRFWTWCFRTELCTLFKIADTRGSRVLIDVLGDDFDGVIGCDYFSAYRKYMNDCDIRVQFCLAHLIRELKYLAGLPDKATADYGQRLLDAMREMFHIFHKAEERAAGSFTNAMEESRNAFLNIALNDVPDSRPAQNFANRFRQYGRAYFRFITTPGIEPTNNFAELAIRFVVIDRHITQGTRSENGRAWCERIWSVLATCTSQGQNAFKFICQSIQAYFSGQPYPSLLGP